MTFPRSDLRELPPVAALLDGPALADLRRCHGRDCVRDWVRDALAELRSARRAGPAAPPAPRERLAALVVAAVRARAAREQSAGLGPAVNATGVVLHTGLGRAPLCRAAREALAAAAGACNLEVDAADGERRYRGYQLQTAFRRLTGAEAALVVNNNAAATVLVLDALCCGREVVLSRGQLIEIGGSFRLPEIFAHSGAVLHEVGTTNRTRLSDYERAISAETAALLRVHPSNFAITGFAESPGIAELAVLAHARGLWCLDDIGSGCLVDTTAFGLPREPTFTESLAAGADVVLGSGDKLLGGPQCGILLGSASLITRLREHPLARAFRVDKLTLAALAATLDCYLRGAAESEIPVWALLGASAESLLSRAGRLREELAPSSGPLTITVGRDQAPVGGGALPGGTLPTAVLRVTCAHRSASELARALRLGPGRVFGRIHEDTVLLDLRSVAPEEDSLLSAALRDATRTAAPAAETRIA